MTALLIATAVLTGIVWAALRLHAGWAPPPPPPPPLPKSEFQLQLEALLRGFAEMSRVIGEAFLPVGKAFAEAFSRIGENQE